MISGLSPHILAPRVAAIRAKAAELGRKPEDIKIFAPQSTWIKWDADCNAAFALDSHYSTISSLGSGLLLANLYGLARIMLDMPKTLDSLSSAPS